MAFTKLLCTMQEKAAHTLNPAEQKKLCSSQPQHKGHPDDIQKPPRADAAQQDVTIRPLNGEERPWLLFYTDVAPGPDMWGLTPYFDKQSVTIAEPN